MEKRKQYSLKPENKILEFIKGMSRRQKIIAGSAAAAIAVLAIVIISFAGRPKKQAAEEEIIETLPAETAEVNEVTPVSINGPVFPSMDIAIPTTEAVPEYMRNGTENWIVSDLQQRLMDLGFMDSDEPTDYYGSATEEAVRMFQRQHGLAEDGVVGHDTLKKIFSDEAHYYAAKKGDSGDDIIAIQQRLYQLGYLADAGMVTGNFGEKTEEAVLKLQDVNKITKDGKVGRETYNLIYSDEVKANLLVYGEKSDVVLKAQKRLFDLGYLTSEPDGTYGADTSAAIKVFQGKNALVQDGYLGPETREVLMSSRALHNGLGLGDENEIVLKVQQLLAKWGYLNAKNATGYFGEITQKAVRDFQQRNGLSQDGMVGAQTMAKLASDKVKKPAPKSSSSGSSQTSGGSSSQGSSGSSAAPAQTQAASGGGTQVADAGSNQQSVANAYVPNTDANGMSDGVSNLLSVARSKLGCGYVWGSKGPNTFDCSGFVYWCLNNAGVSQSYITSSGWRSVGKYTRIGNYSDLRTGDIIVVSGHVGIISTGGNIIDASSSNGRVIERPLGSWWANHFIVGWRIF